MYPACRSILVIATVAAAGCGSEPPTGPITGLPRELSVAEGRLIAADNRFAFKLFREIAGQASADANVFISPLSAAMALGMTYNGAAGGTQAAMQQALELGGLTREEVNQSYRSLIDLLRGLDPHVTFELANSIWYRHDYTFRQEFLDLGRTYFDAEVRPLDFAAPGAARTINDWVNERTRGRITDIVPDPLPDYAIMYLINAIYFKGDWTYRFDRDRTQGAPFTRADGSTTSVPMMTHGEAVPVRVYGDGDVEVLDLPYAGRAYSMTIVVPRSPAAIDSVAARLTQDRWDAWIAGLDSARLEVFLPRFNLQYELTMNDALAALGMGVAFCDSGAFDFTAMDPLGEACLTNVRHKTWVDVNEEGTEAAAATSVEVGLVSLPPSFRVDRPFLFAIRERLSGTILFLGRVMDPSRTN